MKLFRIFLLSLGVLAGVFADEPVVEHVEQAAAPESKPAERRERWDQRDRAIFKWGQEAYLPAGEEAGDVGALFGPVRADGKAWGNVWAVFGPVALGSTGDAEGNVVAVLGNVNADGRADGNVVAVLGKVRVNGPVDGNVVSILGGVELGPKARVEGNVVSIGAPAQVDPAAVIDEDLVEVGAFKGMPELTGLQAWVRHALLLGRPLALHRDTLWAWGVAGVFLMLYLFIALVMGRSLNACAETLEERPGKTVLAAFLTVLLTPLLLVVLSVTVVGAPLLFVVSLVAGLIGKAAFLCWLGRRVTLALGLRHALPAVLVGGVLMLGFYLIPFLGFLLLKLTDTLGLGMVVYTLMLAGRSRQKSTTAGAAPAGRNDGGPGASGSGNAFVPPAPPVPVAPVMPVAPSFTPGAGDTAGVQSSFVAVPPVVGVEQEMGAQGQAQTQSVPTGTSALPGLPKIPVTAATLVRAGFGVRLGALLIDCILIFAMGPVLFNSPTPVMFIMAVYLVVLWALKGTTIGGIICGLKIVRLDDRPIDWTTALVRGLAGFLSVLPCGLGFIWVIFDEEKQAWHDKVAGTVVVYAPKGMSLV